MLPAVFLERFYLFIFREGEKHRCVVASRIPSTGDLTHNPGVCPRLRMELVTLRFEGWSSIH